MLRRTRALLALAIASGALVLSAGASATQAAIIYVKHDATGTNTGASWSNACVYLQDALTKSAAGDEIWIAAGRYTPDRGVGYTALDRQAHFSLRGNVPLYGGFAGNETQRGQRDWRTHVTILSGDLLGNDGPNHANRTDNSAYVVWVNAVLAPVTIDGVQVTAAWDLYYSSGMFAQNGGWGVQITNCDFRDNGSDTANTMGGALLANGDVVVRDCIFADNVAYQGGAVRTVENGSAMEQFERCVFKNNRAIYGGACFAFSNSKFTNCQFIANQADSGGGLATGGGGHSPLFINCTFVGNSARVGGAVKVMEQGKLRLVNCTLAANQSHLPGGGIEYAHVMTPTDLAVLNSVVWGNTVETEQPGHYTQIASTGTTPSDVQVAYSCVEGGFTGYGDGMIAVDPLFADPLGPDGIAGTADDNLRLTSHSPCADAGNNNLVPVGVLLDLAGAPRFSNAPSPNTGVGTPPLVDMGAYEFPVTLLRGDMNCDGTINSFDIDPFVVAIIDPGGYPTAYPDCYFVNADVNLDGRVNNFDIDAFVALLLGQ